MSFYSIAIKSPLSQVVNELGVFIMLILDKQVSILMMNKDNQKNSLSKLNRQAKEILTKAFGGVTVEKTSGTWIDEGVLYKDESQKISCNYAEKLTLDQMRAFMTVINLEFKKGKQNAVSIFVGSTLYIIEPNDLRTVEHIIAKVGA